MLDLRLEQTEDVLADLASLRSDDQTLVGFAAEHGPDAIERARAKLERKGLDAIVFNDVSRADIGFDSALNEVVIVERDGERRVPLAPKEEVADAILDRVEALREQAARGSAGPGRGPAGSAPPRPTLGSMAEPAAISLLPLPAGHVPARGGGLRPGHGAALQGRSAGAREELDPRGARPRLLPQPALRGGGA